MCSQDRSRLYFLEIHYHNDIMRKNVWEQRDEMEARQKEIEWEWWKRKKKIYALSISKNELMQCEYCTVCTLQYCNILLTFCYLSPLVYRTYYYCASFLILNIIISTNKKQPSRLSITLSLSLSLSSILYYYFSSFFKDILLRRYSSCWSNCSIL